MQAIGKRQPIYTNLNIQDVVSRITNTKFINTDLKEKRVQEEGKMLSMEELVTSLLSSLYESTNLPKAMSALLILILIGIFCSIYYISKAFFEKQRMQILHIQKVNEEALNSLYGPLYLYVFGKKNLEDYSPKEAAQFVKDLKDIIAKSPYYSTSFLDDTIANLEQTLTNRNPEYVYHLTHIRTYIITLYDSIREKLHYPKTTKYNDFLITSSRALRGGLIAYILAASTIILYMISCLIVPMLSNAPIFQALVAIFLFIFSASFAISSLVMTIISIYCKIAQCREKKRIKNKWFSKEKTSKPKSKKSKKATNKSKKCSP